MEDRFVQGNIPSLQGLSETDGSVGGVGPLGTFNSQSQFPVFPTVEGGYVSHVDCRGSRVKGEGMTEFVSRLLRCLAVKVSRIVVCCPQILWLQSQFPQTLVLEFGICLGRFAENG